MNRNLTIRYNEMRSTRTKLGFWWLKIQFIQNSFFSLSFLISNFMFLPRKRKRSRSHSPSERRHDRHYRSSRRKSPDRKSRSPSHKRNYRDKNKRYIFEVLRILFLRICHHLLWWSCTYFKDNLISVFILFCTWMSHASTDPDIATVKKDLLQEKELLRLPKNASWTSPIQPTTGWAIESEVHCSKPDLVDAYLYFLIIHVLCRSHLMFLVIQQERWWIISCIILN